MYPYVFEFYPKNLMIMTGKVYILAKDINEARELAFKYYPYHDIISCGKLSYSKMTLGEFQDFVKEQMERE